MGELLLLRKIGFCSGNDRIKPLSFENHFPYEQTRVMRSFILLILAACCAVGSPASGIVTKHFRNPPMEYRPVPLWFWNNTTVEPGRLMEQLENMVICDGYGGCAILPFGADFRPEYLSEEYMSLYEKVVRQAQRLGAQMSLYDEYGFPSGSMGAINADGRPRFMEKHPEATIKRLDKFETLITGGSFARMAVPDGKIMAAVAMNSATGQRISVKGEIADGKLVWQSPPGGSWRVMLFVCVTDGDPNVDYLDPDAVKLFIEETHERYYRRFSAEFGKTITTTFFDEPTMYRAEGRMWSDRFNEKFEARYGFGPDLLYPALWYDIGEETRSARNYLFGFRAELYSQGYMKAIQEWASAHGIQSTGHQDNEEFVNPVSQSGDLMLCGKYMDIPGIDKIGGNRPAELFYKVVSSSAYNWDKRLVMSETYGAMGNVPMDEMYRIAMEQYVKGINYLIPHAVWYDDSDVTFLPELSYRNPIYRDHLPEFNLFLSRLNYILRPEGRHVADIAVVYPIHSLQGDHYLDGPEGYYMGGVMVPDADYIEVSAILTDRLGKDFTYLHPETIDGWCSVEGGLLTMENELNREVFRVTIIPGMRTISLSNLRRLEEFLETGGHVIFTTQLPSYSTETGKDAEVAAIVAEMVAGKGVGKALFVENPTEESVREALREAGIVYDVDFSPGSEMTYIHKVVGDKSVYYFANLNPHPLNGTVRVRGHIVPRLLDPHTGEERRVKYNRTTVDGVEITEIELPVEAGKSVFIVER